MTAVLLAFVVVAAVASFFLSQSRAFAVASGAPAILHSRPSYHGFYSFLWVIMVGVGLVIVLTVGPSMWITNTLLAKIGTELPDEPFIAHQLVLSDAKALATGAIASRTDELRLAIAADYSRSANFWNIVRIVVVIGGALAAAFLTHRSVAVDRRARNLTERIVRILLACMATIAILTTIGIVLSLIFETLNFFSKIDWQIHKFLFGITWSPLSGVHTGEMDADKVGAIPLFAGTLMITLIAMMVAVPIGLFAAIYLSDFASQRVRSIVKPMLEILAGIPTVVYGFFAAITVAPFLRGSGEALGLTVASESALVAGIVMGIMIIPFISSLSDDVINSVPQSLRDGSYGLGATKAETIRQVILPAALPGIVSAALLGFSRAVGETMIVVMAAGQGANLTANPFEAVTTVTVQIVMLITGDTEAETAAGPAFTLGFTLFCVTLLMNILAQRLVRRYRELYD
ncbi:MAG: phosphate ABC transporter permease subunit PstC [Rhodobacter sp.]|nr:phosphate ABC transporter permease subunit PstC [Rhodobacter sp.]